MVFNRTFAAIVLMFGLVLPATASEEAFTVACQGASENVYTIDIQNDRYALLGQSVEIHELTSRDFINIDYYYSQGTDSTTDVFLNLANLVIYSAVETHWTYNVYHSGHCEIVEYIPIDG